MNMHVKLKEKLENLFLAFIFIIITMWILLPDRTIGAELPKFEFQSTPSIFHDTVFNDWIPIVGITSTPYVYEDFFSQEHLAYMKNEVYLFQVGMKYKFDEETFIAIKTERFSKLLTNHFYDNNSVVPSEYYLVLEFRTLF